MNSLLGGANDEWAREAFADWCTPTGPQQEQVPQQPAVNEVLEFAVGEGSEIGGLNMCD